MLLAIGEGYFDLLAVRLKEICKKLIFSRLMESTPQISTSLIMMLPRVAVYHLGRSKNKDGEAISTVPTVSGGIFFRDNLVIRG